MALAPKKGLQETLDLLTTCIDEGDVLDAFTLRRVVSSANSLPDEPTKLMVLGLAYGAAGDNEHALAYFKEAIKYRDDIIARNYLSYLSHTGQHDLYRDECVRLAREIVSFPLYLRARNASYADGDGELSLFFARKALSMVGDENERAKMEMEIHEKNSALNRFIDTTRLSTHEIAELTRMVANIANSFDVLAVSQDYYTGDGDAAIICDVVCTDAGILSDLDIEIAMSLAMNESFSARNLTAWYRGRSREEVAGTL